MKRKLLTLGLLTTAAVLAISNTSWTNPDFPPAARTGAPGESTCTSCHSGVLNSGPGTRSLTIQGNPVDYIPGQTYAVTIAINEARPMFGFEATVLNASNMKAGNLTTAGAGANRTQLQNQGNRQYINHTLTGTSPQGGIGTWTFDWTAPVAGTGPVTFYYVTMAANNAQGNRGDNVYSNTFTFPEGNPSNSRMLTLNGISVINIPSGFALSGEKLERSNLSAYSIDGKLCFNELITGSSFNKTGLLPGLYLLKIVDKNENISFQKIMIY